jgi:hypothetical protein
LSPALAQTPQDRLQQLIKRDDWAIILIWSAAVLVKTRKSEAMIGFWSELWKERALLASEWKPIRKPIQPQTVRYLRRIGMRFWH